MAIVEYLVCPDCRGELSKAGEVIECNNCGTSIACEDGVPSICRAPYAYEDLLSKEEMEHVLKAMDEGGWRAALKDVMADRPQAYQYLDDFLTSERRAAWKFLLPLRSGKRALDFGCGWGAISIGLARSYDQVCAADLDARRLRFLKKRADETGLTGIEFVHTGDLLPLPFADNSFDVVVMNGVLEWVPETFVDCDPWEAQKLVLTDMRRILRPGGQVLVAIENRLSYEYLLGRPEEHQKIKYISLMPRTVASWYLRTVFGKGFRTYTYTHRGYRKLLQSAGLKPTIYVPYPQYRDFKQIISVDEGNLAIDVAKSWVRSPWKKWIIAKRSFRQFLPSVLAIGTKGERERNFLEELGAVVERGIGGGGLVWANYFITSGSRETVLLEGRGCEPVLVRLPLTPAADAACASNRRQLEALWSYDTLPDDLRAALPKAITEGRIGNQRYFVESRVPGRSIAGPENEDSRLLRTLTAGGTEVAAKLHRATRDANREALVQALDRVLKRVKVAIPEEQEISGIGVAAEDYLHVLEQYGCPVVFGHGDFKLENFLIMDGRISGVVDWENSNTTALPYLDCLNLYFDAWLCLSGRSRADLHAVCSEFLLQFRAEKFFESQEQLYIEALNLDEQVIPCLQTLFYLQKVGDRFALCGQESDVGTIQTNLSAIGKIV